MQAPERLDGGGSEARPKGMYNTGWQVAGVYRLPPTRHDLPRAKL